VPGRNATFDYVVIGSGLAGSVVASRLAEDPSLSVAVVEAGGFPEISNGNLSQIPYFSTDYVSGDPDDWQPLIDWGLVSTPQPQNGNRTIHYAQGKCIGGSSARNQLIYHRGTRGSYDLWAQEVGNEAFAWNNILPYFEKSVNFSAPDMRFRAANSTPGFQASAYTPSGGPLHVSFLKFANAIASYAHFAFGSVGMPQAPDFSSGILNGYNYFPFTVDPTTSLRSSSETSFLNDAFAKTSLRMYQSTQVTKILFNSNKTATGVEVNTQGFKYTLSARKEVILSAGAMHSPQLLMLSGVGPASTLCQHNISVVADRPGVGQNMHDSANIGGVRYEVNVPTLSVLNEPAVLAETTINYLNNGSGPLSNPGGDFVGWTKLPNRAALGALANAQLAQWPADWPEIELVVSAAASTLTADSGTSNIASVGALLVATTSRGNVTIRSNSIADQPVISMNWLLSETDQRVAVEAYKYIRALWQGFPDSVRLGEEIAPGSNVTTDEQILEHIKTEGVGAIHHASSTCRMGMRNDSMSVVDSSGKVIGVEGLRVIDSSSFRFTPPGHTQGATYAHAELLVDMVKKGL